MSKKLRPKTPKKLIPKPGVKKAPSKPMKKLKKSDPGYFAKIGAISAAKRRLDSDYFSNMARLSHGPKANRKKKDAD